MSKHYPLLVAGSTSSNTELEVTAPYDGQVLATMETADSAIVEGALAVAHRVFEDRDQWLPQSERIDILKRVKQAMQDEAEELAVAAATEGGKPLIDSRIEVARAIDGIDICIETLRTDVGREIPMNVNPASTGRLAMTHKMPIGPVVAVSAFNHPLNLIVHQVTPAVATGCPVVVKPAQDTPLSCYRFISMLHEAGLPKEWAQALVTKDVEVASQLVTDDRVEFFSFIGSARVGWMLRSRLSPGTRCALEHGGAAPVIVAEDADLDSTVPLLARAGFYHAGQVCVSVQRVFAHHSIAKQLAQAIATEGEAMTVGDPTLEETDVGPLIRHTEADRIAKWVDEAVADGAQKIAGGERLSPSTYSPTVLFNPKADTKVSRLEIFGPVICVYPYDDIDQAIAMANDVPFSFQSAVFTQSLDTMLRVYNRINASAIMANDHTAFRVDWMPFAGLKTSGLGIGGIPYTMHDMQIEKMLVIKNNEFN